MDGGWSYDFSSLGHACATSERDPHIGRAKRCNVLKAAANRVFRAADCDAAFRVLDVGAGSGGWLLQAELELEDQLLNFKRRTPVAIHLHGVTGDSMVCESEDEVRSDRIFEVAHFQQVGIETFPLRHQCGSEEHRAHFARTVGAALMGGSGGYDLIVSSWTFCHLLDPLATLEIWSNTLSVGGELYLNDIDFSVQFESEGKGAVLACPHSRDGAVGRGDVMGRAPPQGTGIGAGAGTASVATLAFAKEISTAFWETDPEKRMARTFEILNAKGEGVDGAFSIEFVYDEKDYRTAVKLTRLSTLPIRFGPTVGYCRAETAHCGAVVERRAPSMDGFGRPVYCVSCA